MPSSSTSIQSPDAVYRSSWPAWNSQTPRRSIYAASHARESTSKPTLCIWVCSYSWFPAPIWTASPFRLQWPVSAQTRVSWKHTHSSIGSSLFRPLLTNPSRLSSCPSVLGWISPTASQTPSSEFWTFRPRSADTGCPPGKHWSAPTWNWWCPNWPFWFTAAVCTGVPIPRPNSTAKHWLSWVPLSLSWATKSLKYSSRSAKTAPLLYYPSLYTSQPLYSSTPQLLSPASCCCEPTLRISRPARWATATFRRWGLRVRTSVCPSRPSARLAARRRVELSRLSTYSNSPLPLITNPAATSAVFAAPAPTCICIRYCQSPTDQPP